MEKVINHLQIYHNNQCLPLYQRTRFPSLVRHQYIPMSDMQHFLACCSQGINAATQQHLASAMKCINNNIINITIYGGIALKTTYEIQQGDCNDDWEAQDCKTCLKYYQTTYWWKITEWNQFYTCKLSMNTKPHTAFWNLGFYLDTTSLFATNETAHYCYSMEILQPAGILNMDIRMMTLLLQELNPTKDLLWKLIH